MNLPKSFIKNRLFEIGRTVITSPRKKTIEFYHKKLTWWIDIYGIRFKHNGYYVMLKKICF
jgi:hypothetical protein